MLTIVLRILSILGILLLVLFLLAAVVLLLILFVPVTYRISGARDENGFRISARVKWMAGGVRLRYGYPEPGEVVAKVLFFTLYRAKIPPEETAEESGRAEDAADKSGIKRSSGKIMTALRKKKSPPEKKRDASKKKTDAPGKRKKAGTAKPDNSGGKNAADNREEDPDTGTADSVTNTAETAAVEEKQTAEEAEKEASAEENPSTDGNASVFGKILQKFEKIKYTIHNIYDKIREIWNNISYYLELLQEEETRQLFSHIRMRAGKMLKSVRPRHIRANVLFGTGSPDTTGYLYGAYCMISPMLRKDVDVTPDFEQAVLQGDFDVSGHIAIWVLAVNACRIALDKRLWHLIKKAVSPGIKTAKAA